MLGKRYGLSANVCDYVTKEDLYRRIVYTMTECHLESKISVVKEQFLKLILFLRTEIRNGFQYFSQKLARELTPFF